MVSTAGAGTLAMARKLSRRAITLDLGLADIDGFVLLDLLKHDPETSTSRSTSSPAPTEARRSSDMGAFGVTEKPAERDELVGVFSRCATEADAEAARAARKP